MCGKSNHQVLDCFRELDFAYQERYPRSELAVMVSQSNVLHEDNGWIANSRVTNHITTDLNKFTLQQPFQGIDIVTVGNGNTLHISHIGCSFFKTPNSIVLKNISHCPNAIKQSFVYTKIAS